MTARTFTLVRSADPSGISGVGVVAEGTVWSDGSVALRWLGDHPATAVWPSLDEVLAVHGHNGATVAVFPDEPPVDESLPGAMNRVTSLMASGLRVTNMSASPIDNRVQVHVRSEDWQTWVEALGGSIDAAVRTERLGASEWPWEWRWTSPDGRIRCFFITADENAVELENG